MIKRAILSVFDKTDIVDLAKKLRAMDVEILSTGGTLKTLQDAGVEVTSVSDVTGFPECLDGRVKTLHPKIHGGILAMRSNPAHMQRIEELGIEPIDLVVINLYPFHQTILKSGVTLPEAIENIDIGGPTMLRASAKNFEDVTVVVDPADYGLLIGEMQEHDRSVSRDMRMRLAEKVFAHTAQYDTLISGYLRGELGAGDGLPEKLNLTYQRRDYLRYGENPHQKAALYAELFPAPGSVTDMLQLGGRKLSYNNIHDADIALKLLHDLQGVAVIAVKQANPCAAGISGELPDAWEKCIHGNERKLSGGLIAANREIYSKIARELLELKPDCVLAPSFTEEALEILGSNRALRILKVDTGAPSKPALDLTRVSGGLLVQQADDVLLPGENIRIVTERNPEKRETMDAVFAWAVAKHVDSNAVVVAKNGRVIGIGSGQSGRLRATMEALEEDAEANRGAALASDAFFTSADSVQAAADAGISVIIQPGGSPTDDAAIEICNAHDTVMLFTDMRHFTH